MTKYSIVAHLTLLVVLFTGCTIDGTITGEDQIVGSGRVIAQPRTVGTFSGIRVMNVGKVLVTQDSVESLRIECDDNITDRVETSVQDDILLVGLKEGSYRNVTLRVYAAMRNIKRLELIGAADIATVNAIQTDSILCSITGAGSINLTGTANTEVAQIRGSGSISNFGLSSARCSALIAGVGNIEVTVSQQLDAVISGTGNITYAGNPPLVRQTITGVGSVTHRR